MSVALLQNDRHVHEILDDRESAFHVLTWSALRYTAHSSRDDVGPHMKPYNEIDVYRNGNVKGGFRKELMIRKPLEVTFYPPALHNLIEDLRIWFEERYRVVKRNVRFPQGPKNFPNANDVANDAAQHDELCEVMRTQGTLVAIFRQWLAEDWPEDDTAQDNYTRKRKASHSPTTSYCSSKSRKGDDGSRQ